jgi:hypothetical protein
VRNKLAISDERFPPEADPPLAEGVRDKIERKRVREMSERENP